MTAVAEPVQLAEDLPPLLLLSIRGGAPYYPELLTLREVDGKLVAEYRPADLDAAALQLVEAVAGLLGRVVPPADDTTPEDPVPDGGVTGCLVPCPHCAGQGLRLRPDNPELSPAPPKPRRRQPAKQPTA